MPSLFRQSFLFDTLDFDHDVVAGEMKTAAGVTLKLHQRGILEVIPAKQAQNHKNIIISCGINGNETAPIELMDKLVDDICSNFQVIEDRCLFIIAHPQAVKQNSRFIDENLNRLFDDRASSSMSTSTNIDMPKSVEAKIAAQLKRVVEKFYFNTPNTSRWHLDLHCTVRPSKHYSFVISPKSRHAVRSRALVAFVENAHIDAMLLSNSPSNTFSWYTADYYGANALTMELGQAAPLGQNQLQRLIAYDLALRDLLAHDESEHLSKRVILYRVNRSIMRLHDDFSFLFDENIENFTSFMHGEVFGHNGEKPLMAKNEDEAIVFPNPNALIGHRAALMVCKVRARYEDDQLVYD